MNSKQTDTAVAAPTGQREETIRAKPRSLTQQLERSALPILLLLVVVFFCIFPASRSIFPTVANASVVLANQSVVVLVATALLFPLVCGHFDFSVGATAVFSSLVCAASMAHFGLPVWAACLAATCVGALIGVVNGIIVGRFGMNAFVSTLGMATLLGGLVQWYSGGLAVIGIDSSLTDFGSRGWLGLPRTVYVVLVALLVAWYLLTHTPFGRALYALGSNSRSAMLVGIPQKNYTQAAFLISGILAAVAGIILTARTGGANPDTGTSLLFPALTAAFLGTTAFHPGRFNLLGTVVGVLFVAATVSGLTLSGADNWVDQVFNGAALLAAVGLSSYLRRKREGNTD